VLNDLNLSQQIPPGWPSRTVFPDRAFGSVASGSTAACDHWKVRAADPPRDSKHSSHPLCSLALQPHRTHQQAPSEIRVVLLRRRDEATETGLKRSCIRVVCLCKIACTSTSVKVKPPLCSSSCGLRSCAGGSDQADRRRERRISRRTFRFGFLLWRSVPPSPQRPPGSVLFTPGTSMPRPLRRLLSVALAPECAFSC
jgi:hypothetical protein